VVLAAFQLFIAQYSNQTAIALAMPIFGRNQSQWHKTLGLFVNTQIYTAALDYQATFLQLIKHTKQQMLNDAAYTDIPYNLLLKKFYETELCAPGTACNVLFNYIQMPVLQFGNAVPHAHYCLMPTSKFELSLHNYVTQNHFYLIFEYATDLFKLATIQHFAEYFQQLLQACIADPDVSLTAITEAL
jgi:non-ribosomal peptide synthetase component F